MLRDQGCTTVLVRLSLVPSSQLSGRKVAVQMANGTVDVCPEAAKKGSMFLIPLRIHIYIYINIYIYIYASYWNTQFSAGKSDDRNL